MKLAARQGGYSDDASFHSVIFTLSQPLSETDILNLQDKFLTPGFHYIKVQDIAAGRHLIMLFLTSLNTYHTVACLTVARLPLSEAIIDVYQEFISTQSFDSFIFESGALDFMWVEANPELHCQPWFDEISQTIIDNNLDTQIPIIFLTYE
jgi:hypothetical protein